MEGWALKLQVYTKLLVGGLSGCASGFSLLLMRSHHYPVMFSSVEVKQQTICPWAVQGHWLVSCNFMLLRVCLFGWLFLWCIFWYHCKGDALTAMLVHAVTPTFALLKIGLCIHFFCTESPKYSSVVCADEQRKDQNQMEVMIGEGRREKERGSGGNYNGNLAILFPILTFNTL